jgi:hypothetical protein
MMRSAEGATDPMRTSSIVGSLTFLVGLPKPGALTALGIFSDGIPRARGLTLGYILSPLRGYTGGFSVFPSCPFVLQFAPVAP